MPPETKTCKVHGTIPISECYAERRSDSKKINYRCRLCLREKSRRLSRTEKYKLKAKEYNSRPVIKLKAKQRYQNDKELFYRRTKKSQQKLRMQLLRHYSGSEIPFCECCKENNLEFLALDHKFGGGNEHRRQIGGNKCASGSVFLWARKNNYPDIFRVLCHNCNFAYHKLGCCPHQSESAHANV